MSNYLEIPNLDKGFPFRRFVHEGEVLVYPHWHKMIEVIYVTKGTLHLGINDIPIHMQAGEIQFINGGDVHYFLASPNSERIVIQFDLTFFQEDEMQADGEPSLRQLFAKMKAHSTGWSKETVVKMQTLLHAIHIEDETKPLGYKYLIKAKLMEMVALLYREIPAEEDDKTRILSEEITLKSEETLEKLDEIFSYIEAHYKEPISLEEMARFTGFSIYYFTKFFKKNTGVTFVTFLNDYRLNQAKWLLINEEIPMAEVAEQVGFSSVKTFHHAFKRAMGIAPLKYRKTIYGNKLTRN
ncbi:helix-turn-helix domain-containing protein [Listeria ilorinensis]|uniref:helix-turn-helix domain-containing protein n=1 Tax=Listeria ilorinensis TaxID=2867439 RepID=UPI001EF4864C|nr:AraC family transcriptional regulator [Listeria ilorinensis]